MFLIGIAIGAVCALVVLCIVFYCLYKKGYCASKCTIIIILFNVKLHLNLDLVEIDFFYEY